MVVSNQGACVEKKDAICEFVSDYIAQPLLLCVFQNAQFVAQVGIVIATKQAHIKIELIIAYVIMYMMYVCM